MMKSKRLLTIKNSKPFLKHDVLVYAVLALFVALLFVFLLFPKNYNSNGFLVTKNNQKVLSYNYEDDSLIIDSAFSNLIEQKSEGDKLIIKIFDSQQKQRFNTLEINKKNKTVDVIDANCSSSKECVHMTKISSSGFIYCAPHSLSITSGYIPPTIG